MNDNWEEMDNGIATEEYNEQMEERKDYFLFVERTPAFNCALNFFVIVMILSGIMLCYLFSNGI